MALIPFILNWLVSKLQLDGGTIVVQVDFKMCSENNRSLSGGRHITVFGFKFKKAEKITASAVAYLCVVLRAYNRKKI